MHEHEFPSGFHGMVLAEFGSSRDAEKISSEVTVGELSLKTQLLENWYKEYTETFKATTQARREAQGLYERAMLDLFIRIGCLWLLLNMKLRERNKEQIWNRMIFKII